jgi:hypothetical protein
MNSWVIPLFAKPTSEACAQMARITNGTGVFTSVCGPAASASHLEGDFVEGGVKPRIFRDHE